MAATLLDGPLGNDGRATINGFTIMDSSVLIDYANLPYAVADVVTGLHDMSDADDPRDNSADQMGEVPYPRLLRGKTIVWNGRVIGRTLQEPRQTVTALRGAVSNAGSDGPLTIAPHPAYGGISLTCYGRVTACPCDDRQENDSHTLPSPWQRKFILSFRLRDPRFFDLDPAHAITGGAASGVTATLLTVGNAPLDPVFTVATPGGAVVLTHMGTSRKITFRSDTPAGSLVVNFNTRQASIGSRDVSGFIDRLATDWWDRGVAGLEPASSNILKVDGGAWSVSASPGTW